MPYTLKLESALYLVGLLLVVAHALALFQPKAAQDWLRGLPRSKGLGFLFVTVAAAWFAWLVWKMDLGEFSNWRTRVLIGTPIAWWLAWRYVDEFLAVRGLGMLVLLGAEPLLGAAFLRPEMSRLFLVSLVYVWVGFALFWVGMPYTLRDQIGWVTGDQKRWRAAAFAGLAFGALLLVLPLTYGRPA